MKIVNLLDDFTIGGVTKGLSVFEEPELRSVGEFCTLPINPDKFSAPSIDADIIITHFPPNWRRLAFLVMLRLRNPRAQLIHVEHSYCREWERRFVSSTRRFRLMLKASLKLFHAVVCVSEAQASWLSEVIDHSGTAVHVINPYAGHSELTSIPQARTRAGGTLRVGAYGRLHEAKGFDRLILAMKELRGNDAIELFIGGGGPEESALKALAADLPNVHFTGHVTAVGEFLRQCDIVAIPSRYETFGQVATEARLAGRPILVSCVDSLKQQASGNGFVVDCDKPEAIAAMLLHLQSVPLDAHALAARWSVRNFRDQCVGAWSKLFDMYGTSNRRAASLRRPSCDVADKAVSAV